MARTNVTAGVKYRMRGSDVLVRKVRKDQVRGLYMPDASMQGWQFVIEETGPKVEGLSKGDVVFMRGVRGADYCELPNDNNLLVIDEANVMVVLEPVPSEAEDDDER